MKKKIALILIVLLAVGSLFGYLHTRKSKKINYTASFLEKRERDWLTVKSTLREFLNADYAQQQFLCRMLADLNFTHEDRKYDEWVWWYYLTSFDELSKDDTYGKATIEEILYWTVVASEEARQRNTQKGRRSIAADQRYKGSFPNPINGFY